MDIRMERAEMKKYYLLFVPVILIYVLIWMRNYGWISESKPKEMIEFCPLGWKKFENSCYRAFYQLSSLEYHETIPRCQQSSGWPAVLASRESNVFIHSLLDEQGAAFGPAFIGLLYSTKTGTHQWHTGTALNFTDWEEGEPISLRAKDCVTISDKTKKWTSVPCSLTSVRRYVCQRSVQALDQAMLQVPKPDRSVGVGEFTEEMRHSALVAGKRREKKGFLTIGLPTMHRRSGRWYLKETLDSLIKYCTSEEKREVVLVVFLSDFDPNARSMLKTKLTATYQNYMDSGFIQVIEAPSQFYPSFDNLRTTYQHPMGQIIWRSKQNFDFAFLMQYSETISEFYLQLEDDVITVPNYVSIIKRYITRITRKAKDDWWSGVWTCLEFNELGFIGKLFHSHDLVKLASLLKLFYNEQPNDVLLLHFNEMMLQFKRYIRIPTIFQHRGLVSSLHLKREPLVDLMFNPNASLNDSSSENRGKRLIPVEVRRLNNLEGPEQELWEERKKLLRKMFCKSQQA